MTETSTPKAVGAPLHVFLVAGETSGDHLGAALMAALKQRHPDIRFSGVGGPAMQAAGLQTLFPIDEVSIIGIGGIVKKLPLLLRLIRQAADAAVSAQPDALVIIDSPEFTHRVARRVRARAPSIPVIDYVSPSVWAWRPWRARAMRRYVDHVLGLLPFEPAVHVRLGGPPCTYVGHPLIESMSLLRPTPDELQRRNANPPELLVLPGSRGSELRRLLEPFGRTIELLAGRIGAFDLVLPTLPHLEGRVREATGAWARQPRIVIDETARKAAFRTARAALAASGTVTLELALAGVPTVAAYRVSGIEAVIARALIRSESVILANLVLGERIIPEFLQEDCRPETLADALAPLLGETAERKRQVDAFARLDAIMEIGASDPSQRSADIVLAEIGLRRG